jgi:hypothetical protein
MRLPNGDKAVVDPRKLTDYCLNPTHPLGKHKARLFADATGITLADWGLLHAELLRAADARDDAVATDRTPFGQKYEITFTLAGPRGGGRSAAVLSVWIVGDDQIPRLVTCYPV